MPRTSVPRRTKILCTIGPAVSGVDNLVRLIYSGMDAARLNFSHGTYEEHLQNILDIRTASDIAKKPVTILQDLQGPKIRTGKVENGQVLLEDGQKFIITVDYIEFGNSEKVSTNYTNLINEVQTLNTILLDDGYIILKVSQVVGNDIVTQVVKGGILKDKKGIIVPGSSSKAPSLSEKDIADLKFGLANGVDAVALSFVRSRRDILELKAVMKVFGKEVPIIAKIERWEAYEVIDEIIDESTAIMVARGDLGLEMPAERVPLIQKEIIKRCNEFGKPVITATQMLESMIFNPRPTRAEASDVANAVLDGSDTVMLSGETSVGKYPFDAVGYMSRIITNIEESYPFHQSKYNPKLTGSDIISDALGNAACVIADQINAAAIVTLTSSAYTAKNIANYRPRQPIVALTHVDHVFRRLSMVWGITPILVPEVEHGVEDIFKQHLDLLNGLSFIMPGDYVVFVAGLSNQKLTPQNILKVYKV